MSDASALGPLTLTTGRPFKQEVFNRSRLKKRLHGVASRLPPVKMLLPVSSADSRTRKCLPTVSSVSLHM